MAAANGADGDSNGNNVHRVVYAEVVGEFADVVVAAAARLAAVVVVVVAVLAVDVGR